jgi:hypothetical protein
MVTFIIYKIYCDSLSDIYIGSTNNLNRKIVDHKKDCYNKNVAKYNNKLYTFIRDKGGFDNWKFEILETLESSNEEMKKKEQYYINKLNPSLNTYRAYRSIDDLQEFKRIKSHRQYYNNIIEINEKKKEKFICDCGGRYTLVNKSTHFKQKIHKEWELLNL